LYDGKARWHSHQAWHKVPAKGDRLWSIVKRVLTANFNLVESLYRFMKGEKTGNGEAIACGVPFTHSVSNFRQFHS
jgi:hypothetical protein